MQNFQKYLQFSTFKFKHLLTFLKNIYRQEQNTSWISKKNNENLKIDHLSDYRLIGKIIMLFKHSDHYARNLVPVLSLVSSFT